jgi:AraC-like DNA-binding protein
MTGVMGSVPSGGGGAGEWADVVTSSPLDGLELIQARYVTHAFPTHAHAEYVIGVVTQGAKESRYGSSTLTAQRGTLTLFNPFEEHSSRGLGGSWTYAAFYPTPGMMQRWFGDLPGAHGGGLQLKGPAIDDPVGARLIPRLHASLRGPASALAAQSAFVEVAAHFLASHGAAALPAAPSFDPRVRRARERLDDDLADDVGLAELASLAGLPPLTLLRAFRRSVGCSPQVYRTARRVAAAKRALAAGAPLARTALDVGFYDQSHFTRVFRRWTGVTPGAFVRKVRGRGRWASEPGAELERGGSG